MQLFKSCFRNIWKHGTNCSAKCLQLRPQHKNHNLVTAYMMVYQEK